MSGARLGEKLKGDPGRTETSPTHTFPVRGECVQVIEPSVPCVHRNRAGGRPVEDMTGNTLDGGVGPVRSVRTERVLMAAGPPVQPSVKRNRPRHGRDEDIPHDSLPLKPGEVEVEHNLVWQVINSAEGAVLLENLRPLGHFGVQLLVEDRCPTVGNLLDHGVEILAQELRQQTDDTFELSPLDLFDVDSKPGCRVGAGFDVHACFDLEPELPQSIRVVVGPADMFGDGSGDRRTEFAFDLTGGEEPTEPMVDRQQPVRVHSALILPLFSQTG